MIVQQLLNGDGSNIRTARARTSGENGGERSSWLHPSRIRSLRETRRGSQDWFEVWGATLRSSVRGQVQRRVGSSTTSHPIPTTDDRSVPNAGQHDDCCASPRRY